MAQQGLRRSGTAVLGLLLSWSVLLPAGPGAAVATALPAQAADAQSELPAQAADAQSEPPAAGMPPLQPLDAEAAPGIDASLIAARLGPLLADPALGSTTGAAVLDGATGQVLLDLRAGQALTPASSLKIATALSVLNALGPQEQLATEVVRASDGALVLVGGGDPTLLTLPPASQDAYPAPATLAELADATAQALRSSGVTQVPVRYDATLFSGPAVSPDWDPGFVGLGIVSPVSALTLDPASAGIDGRALDADPAAATAKWFADRLGSLGIAVSSVAAGAAESGAAPIARVLSPPVGALVDRMLDISDNDVAEALFRLAAIGAGLPPTFAGGAQAATATLQELGVPTAGLVIRDGSGLSRSNRIAPQTLAAALQLATEPEPPGAAGGSSAATGQPTPADIDSLTWAPPGLPVGGLTGSLAGRFSTPDTAAGAGRVHAKTGTLTDITSLTGIVATEQGRPLSFAVLSNSTPNTVAARVALDRIAASLAACGCAAATP